MTRRPVGRLVAAVLLAILLGTSVHGASSVAAPISAIATAHASIGAALFRSTSFVEHDEDRVTPGRAATQRWIDEEFRPPPDESLPDHHLPTLPAAVNPAASLTAPSTSAASPLAGPDETVSSGSPPAHPSRAPPA
ncbi:MAG TPA: hypothetical protein VFX60_07450 [Micromonospora sp.]|nr:hypothetical protein [Micromonospora sp.]